LPTGETGSVRLRYRVVVALLVLTALSGLFVHAELTEDERNPYPDADELAADYDGYVGDDLLVTGYVTAVDGDGFTIEFESDGETISLRVSGAAAAVKPGGVVQVYGELRPERTMAGERVVVVNDSSGAEWYKYGVSAVGAIGFLIIFFRQWRVDAETWTLEARDG